MLGVSEEVGLEVGEFEGEGSAESCGLREAVEVEVG